MLPDYIVFIAISSFAMQFQSKVVAALIYSSYYVRNVKVTAGVRQTGAD